MIFLWDIKITDMSYLFYYVNEIFDDEDEMNDLQMINIWKLILTKI